MPAPSGKAGVTTVGIIGAGRIGSQLARLATRNGYAVVVSNSRGPHTLVGLVRDLGPNARAGTSIEAAHAGDIVIVSVPLYAYAAVPVEPLAGKVVVDTSNYYPARDGVISSLEDESMTTAELMQRHLRHSLVVKAFNHIGDAELTRDASPAGAPRRRALAIAGDNQEAKDAVAAFIDTIGFDPLDVGPLSAGWRYQRDTLAYHGYQARDELTKSLAGAMRYRDISEPQRTAP